MSNTARALAAALSEGQGAAQENVEAFLRDLTAQARAGHLSPVVGRDTEILQMLEVT